MKPLTLGAGHLWVLMVPWGMNQWWNGIWNESYEIKWSYDLRSYERNFYICVEKPEKFRTLTGFEPVTSRFRCDALTNWAMKPLTLGAGHLWVLMVPWGMNQWWNGIWNESYELRIWNQVKPWSSQLRTQFLQLRREAWKIQDFNGVWTRDLAIPVRRSNQLSYEATDVGSWSFVGSNGPVRNESMMKWYMKWIIWNQVKLWSSQLRTQFLQLRREAWKIQDFNGVWTRDLAIPVRRSNQLSYEATDVGSWSFVGSDFISAVHMIHFIYHFIIDSFLTGPLEPTNDQLPTSVAS